MTHSLGAIYHYSRVENSVTQGPTTTRETLFEINKTRIPRRPTHCTNSQVKSQNCKHSQKSTRHEEVARMHFIHTYARVIIFPHSELIFIFFFEIRPKYFGFCENPKFHSFAVPAYFSQNLLSKQRTRNSESKTYALQNVNVYSPQRDSGSK